MSITTRPADRAFPAHRARWSSGVTSGYACRVWWIQPVLTVVLGALLGAENLNAPEASGWLRVPALIAALILVAQGLLDFENERRTHYERRRSRSEIAQAQAQADLHAEPRLVSLPSQTPAVREEALAVESDAEIQAREQAAYQVTGTTVRESSGAVLAILVLAVWLGLATLNYST